ncbi:MAG: glycosyltransferase family 1 protein [Chitinophagaceae bacterium]|nr:MAG: glycosyltransferase family 1 protein [Chitinophagaceae bacterium]
MVNTLFLTLKTFSFTGGIEKASRSLIFALQQHESIKLSTFSMYDITRDADGRYLAKSRFKGFGGKRFLFLYAVMVKALTTDRVILSHINLLLFGKLIKTLKPSAKIILWAHGIEVWREIPAWKKKFLQKHGEIWAVSNYTKQQMMARHQIGEQNIKVLHNTLDPFFKLPQQFQKPQALLNKYELKPDSFVLFTLTRLSATEHLKNYDLVIQAVKALVTEFPQIVYLIGGKADAAEHQRLTQIIKAADLDENIKLIGFIEETEIEEHYLLADCFVLPSKKEGFGIVLIEAAACGCQVIGGNVDGSTDALLNGELGQMVNPDSKEEIIHAIKTAIKNKSTHFPEKQQNLAIENFGFEKYVEKVSRLIA